jgi:hypothetical protein
MADYNPQELNDSLISIIQRDKTLADKTSLLKDVEIISSENTDQNKKIASYERLIKYVSYLSKWDDELIAYLGSRFAEIKVRK